MIIDKRREGGCSFCVLEKGEKGEEQTLFPAFMSNKREYQRKEWQVSETAAKKEI